MTTKLVLILLLASTLTCTYTPYKKPARNKQQITSKMTRLKTNVVLNTIGTFSCLILSHTISNMIKAHSASNKPDKFKLTMLWASKLTLTIGSLTTACAGFLGTIHLFYLKFIHKN